MGSSKQVSLELSGLPPNAEFELDTLENADAKATQEEQMGQPETPTRESTGALRSVGNQEGVLAGGWFRASPAAGHDGSLVPRVDSRVLGEAPVTSAANKAGYIECAELPHPRRSAQLEITDWVSMRKYHSSRCRKRPILQGPCLRCEFAAAQC